MAITSAFPNSYKAEILQGLHHAVDEYWIAVYSSLATLNKHTTAYASANEVSGAGYTAGGQALRGFTVTLDDDVACLDWTSDPVWPVASISGRGALIYNRTRSHRAVAVLDFGEVVTSRHAPFTITLPAPTATTAVERVR